MDQTPLPPDKMEKLFEQIKLKEGTSHWTEDQQKRVHSVIKNYSFLFAMDSLDLGQTDRVKHHIDLELVFLKCWAFGKVKKIRGPTTTPQADNTPSTTDVIPGNVPIVDVIPGNVTRKQTRSSKTPQKKVTECTSTRRRPAIDYSKLRDTDDIPSPKKRKRKVNLMRGPSKALLDAHKKRKKMSPLGASQTKLIPATTTMSTSDGASTSTGASLGTVTVQASAEETKVAIKALLALGSDMPQSIDDVTMDNANLVPINPTVADDRAASTSHTVPKPIDSSLDASKPTQSVPVHKRFVTVEYKLKCKRRRTRKFRCAKCDKCFNSQREVNAHFKSTHPSVKCNHCDRFFSCPASMLKHRYSHYETMVECETCGKGFQFKSQLTEHCRVHQLIGDWVCFRPACGKRFKRESELDAHLFNHRSTKIKCDHCDYENADPRNVRAHKRKHENKKRFVCKRCGEIFTWVEQRKRHITKNKCPGQPN